MSQEPQQLARVRYVGGKRASFEMTVNGTTRSWRVQQDKWLPLSEAEAYHRLLDFRIVKRASPNPPPRSKKPRIVKGKEPAALRLDAYLEAAKAVQEAQGEPQELPQFVMSAAGVVHRRGCKNGPKVPYAEFWSLDEIADHSRFKKYHRCV